MTNNSNEIVEKFTYGIGIFCIDENEDLGNYVSKKLNSRKSNFSSEQGGYIEIVKQLLIHQNDLSIKNLKDNVINVKDMFKFCLDYVFSIFATSSPDLNEVVFEGTKKRDEGLKQYWTNISPKIEEQQYLSAEQHADPVKIIQNYIQIISNTIEPLLRFDSYLLIKAYNKKHHESVEEDNLYDLLNKVYKDIIPVNYTKIILQTLQLSNKLDDIRILRNAFKHGNYIISNKSCNITEKGRLKHKILSIDDLDRIFYIIHNLRIFCRTIFGFFFDAFVVSDPRMFMKTEIHLRTVIADLNMLFMEHGLQVIINNDIYFYNEIVIKGEVLTPDLSGKKVFFMMKILINETFDPNFNLSINIHMILKALENIFPYQDNDKKDVLCVLYLTDELLFEYYLFIALDEIEQLRAANITING